MALIEQIADLFGPNQGPQSRHENFFHGAWRFTVSPWRLPSVNSLLGLLKCIQPPDTFNLSASVDGGSTLSLASLGDAAAAEFISELTVYHQIEGGANSIELDISITKKLRASRLTLYDLHAFETSLQKLTPAQCFSTFNEICTSDEGRIVVLKEASDPFETDSLIFTQDDRAVPAIRRASLCVARKEMAHCEGLPGDFLPEDFHLIRRPHSNVLNLLFDRLCLVTILSFLCDNSLFSEAGIFTFKLNGYRAITGSVHRQQVSKELLDELFKVYRWAYLEGNLSDKLGLARNIISLHWKGDTFTAPDPGIYESVLSGYSIYLKENVDKYISLKKSLCDYLSDFSQKSAKLAESVGDKLEKNFVAFAGFFISTILLKAVTEKNLNGLFPRPLQIIAWGMIAASFLHGILSYFFVERERRRVIQDFDLLRRRYGDLLDKADLDRALGADTGFRDNLHHLDFKLRLFFAGWVLMLLICGGTVYRLSSEMALATSKSPAANSAIPSKVSVADTVKESSPIAADRASHSQTSSNSPPSKPLSLPHTSGPYFKLAPISTNVTNATIHEPK